VPNIIVTVPPDFPLEVEAPALLLDDDDELDELPQALSATIEQARERWLRPTCVSS
jgi:hypothetical protein